MSLINVFYQKDFFKNFIYAQISIIVFLLLSSFILPQIPLEGKGISAFGIHFKTLIPYSIGYLLYAYFISRSVKFFSKKNHMLYIIYYTFNIIAILFIFLIFTPYAINTSFDWIHTTVSTALFTIELLFVIYIFYLTKSNITNLFLILFQIMMGVVCIFSLLNSSGLNLLFEGEVLFQLSFVLLTYRLVNNLKSDIKYL